MNRLTRRLERIDAVRTALLDDVARLEPALLTFHPIAGKWSILEIIEHLVLGEQAVMGNLDEPGPPRERSLKNRAVYVLVLFILRFDIPVRVPSKAMLPSGVRSFDELRQSWDENHRRLRALVAGLDRTGRRAAIFRHPVAGPLTPLQAILMMDVHLRRHIRQIRKRQRLLRISANGPASS